MKPAIDQMIAYLEGEMAKYATPAGYMDKGYRVLEQSKTQAEKIKERCDAEHVNRPRTFNPQHNTYQDNNS